MINLCQFKNLSCIGCCGRDFTTKKEIKEGIRKNTLEYFDYKGKKEFGERSVYLRESGICRNLIFRNDKMVCPLHPKLNDDEDLRDHLCDKDFLCETFKQFKKWSAYRRKKFIEFVKLKKPDWYDYSINTDNGIYLKEFLNSKI